MDTIYDAGEELLDVAEFLHNFQDKLSLVESELRECTQQLTADEIEFLENNIDISHLNNTADIRVEPVNLANLHSQWGVRHSISVPKQALVLRCVKERIDGWATSKDRFDLSNKYRSSRFVEPRSETENQSSAAPSCAIKPMSEVLITIRVLAPFKYNPYKKNPLKMDKEIVFLGSQYLTELRDMITCSCDSKGPFLDISQNPSADVRSNDRYAGKSNSGYLFIGDTFYNDLREKENIDYSKEIIEWAKKQPKLKEFHQANLEGTQFLDLKRIQVGSACLYTHFGECEHVFLISDIRIISATDNLIRSDYPYLNLMGRSRTAVCDMCGIYEVNYLVKDSDQHIFDPVRLCGKCLNSYHYVDGKKQGDFTVYHFKN